MKQAFNSVEDFSFSKVTREVLKARLEIPFSIPPYIAQLARAIAILEGIALKVDPNYRLVMEAYPFVTRNLFKDSRDGAKQLLRETLYDDKGRIKGQSFMVLINQALDIVNRKSDAFIDLDTLPEEKAPLDRIVKFIFSGKAESIEKALREEFVDAGDLVLRESVRRTYKGIE